MSARPTHIAVLDAAMNEYAECYRAAREDLLRLKREHADVLKAVRDAERLADRASDELKDLDDALYRLGYPALDDQGNQTGSGGRRIAEAIRANRIESGVQP